MLLLALLDLLAVWLIRSMQCNAATTRDTETLGIPLAASQRRENAPAQRITQLEQDRACAATRARDAEACANLVSAHAFARMKS